MMPTVAGIKYISATESGVAVGPGVTVGPSPTVR